MEAVIQLRTDVAKLMRSGGVSDERADQLVRLKEELDKELARLGVSLRPMHPGAEDAESIRYFLLSGISELGKEEVLPTLRGLEAVTAAYVKPEAEPA